MATPALSNLAACIDDARKGALDRDPGPADPTAFADLRARVDAAKEKLPPLYRLNVVEPFLVTLDELGAGGFAEVLRRDPDRVNAAGLLLDIAQAILQHAGGEGRQAVAAFQEVVSDLYDGFLSAEDRTGVKAPDRGVIPPLVKWGRPDDGPYTWPVDATRSFHLTAGIVSLPPANARKGLMAWSALGHETAGHDILGADSGLKTQLADAIRKGLKAAGLATPWAGYWASRIDETASDVMGILNMGPAAGIGLVAYFRGLDAAYGGTGSLRTEGPADDPHPADILRGWLAAAVVRRLEFAGAKAWADAIDAETNRDLGKAKTLAIAGKTVQAAKGKESAKVVAAAVAGTKVAALELHALDEIQNWRDTDEQVVTSLAPVLTGSGSLAAALATGTYAAHSVAAAVVLALGGRGTPTALLARLTVVLAAMHDKNTSWGPLYVVHPGSMKKELFRRRS